MTNLSYSKIAEIIGVFAVVFSLLFVGVQLYMDRQLALADQYHNRAETRIDTVRSFFENGDYIDQQIRAFKRGSRPNYWTGDLETFWRDRIETEGDVAIGDIFRSEFRAQLQILGFDNIHFQYERGFIEEDFWQNTRNVMKIFMQNPIYRETYSGFILRQAFLDELERIGAEIDEGSDT